MVLTRIFSMFAQTLFAFCIASAFSRSRCEKSHIAANIRLVTLLLGALELEVLPNLVQNACYIVSC
jgi:hypothetical protein